MRLEDVRDAAPQVVSFTLDLINPARDEVQVSFRGEWDRALADVAFERAMDAFMAQAPVGFTAVFRDENSRRPPVIRRKLSAWEDRIGALTRAVERRDAAELRGEPADMRGWTLF